MIILVTNENMRFVMIDDIVVVSILLGFLCVCVCSCVVVVFLLLYGPLWSETNK